MSAMCWQGFLIGILSWQAFLTGILSWQRFWAGISISSDFSNCTVSGLLTWFVFAWIKLFI